MPLNKSERDKLMEILDKEPGLAKAKEKRSAEEMAKRKKADRIAAWKKKEAELKKAVKEGSAGDHIEAIAAWWTHKGTDPEKYDPKPEGKEE